MKILYICPWSNPFIDGFDKYSHPNGAGFGFEELKEMGVNIDWHTHKRNSILYKLFKRFPQSNQIFCQLSCLHKATHYDLIYCGFDMHVLPLAFLRFLKVLKTPVFIVSHFSYNSNYTYNKLKSLFIKFERYFVYNYIDGISFASENLLQVAMQDCHVPLKHQQSSKWGANLFFYNHKLFVNQPKYNQFVASGGKNRDYETLIEAFRLAPSANINIYAKYNGIDKEKTPNVNFIKDEEFRKLGNKRFELLRKEYYNSIAVCIPIKYINDVPNGATVLVEALAMGKPILITRLDTNLIDVEKEGCGLMVNMNDPEDWANKILYLMNHPETVKKMSERSLYLSQNMYNSNLFAETIYNQMQRLISK